MKSKITASIVVCTHNGEKTIKACLQSLLNQNYPKNKYEVIVVDDGSTDKTVEVISKFKVKLIRFDDNKGLSAARNSGLKIARGSIYVCFDDDCVAKPDWLASLVEVYEKQNALGVSGKTVLSDNPRIIDRFLDEYGYTNPSPILYRKNTNSANRFITYIINMVSPANIKAKDLTQVYEIYGANSSFLTQDLKRVHGWNTQLSGVEDTELCYRLRNHFPGKNFYMEPKSEVTHNHGLNFFSFIAKPYNRGLANLKFYQGMNKLPQFFPFPIIYLFLVSLITLQEPILSILALFFFPQLLYFWWPIKFLKQPKLYYLLFPYYQLSYEAMVIAGLLRGYILLAKQKYESKN